MKYRIFESILNVIALSILITTVACSSSKDITVIPIHIVIYTDFQCGACERFHSEVLPELRQLYESNGKANIEIRLLGAIDEASLRAAEAALCAVDQGKALEYEDALFKAWRENDYNAYTIEELISLAQSLDLNEEALKLCLETESKRDALDWNLNKARSDNVSTLPAVIIESIKVEGYKPLDTYIKLIEQSIKNHNSLLQSIHPNDTSTAKKIAINNYSLARLQSNIQVVDNLSYNTCVRNKIVMSDMRL